MTSLKIDSKAAPCTGQDDDDELKKAMQTLGQPKGAPSGSPPSTPKRRGRTKGPEDTMSTETLKAFAASRGKAQATAISPHKAKPRATPGPVPGVASALPAPLEPSVAPAVAAPPPVPAVEPKTEQNPESKAEMEAKFLEIYLTGEHSINDSMKLSGYVDMTDRNRHYIAKQIIQRHEQGGGDPRKLLRAAGLGEVAIALKILELMKSDSQTVQVRACELAAKCLGMTKEGAELPQGITIIIKGRDQAVQVNTPGAPPRPTTSCGQAPGGEGLSASKPICIMK